MENYKDYIINQSKNKKLVIWGMGSYGKASYDMFCDAGIEIKYFCDGNKSKINTKYRNAVCLSSDDVLMQPDKFYVLIANQFANEIVKLLIEKNFKRENINIIPSPYKICFDDAKEKIDESELKRKIDNVYEMLEDDKSKKVLDKLIEAWNKNDMEADEVLDIYEDNQYFCKDIISFDENSVFIDVGAYLGDSLKPFLENAKNYCFKKAICFELNKSIYDKLCNIVEEYNENIKARIEVINKGISDKEETINYISTEGSSHIGSEGAEIGYLSTLDKCIADEAPTLIKMDIEGAELSALKGGSEIIKRFKPDLAICIYHKFQDVWEIPEYIKSLVPEYKIYFRHHSKTLIETVCYATIR